MVNELQSLEIQACQAVTVASDGVCAIGVENVVHEDEKGAHVLISHPSTKRTRKIYWATERFHEQGTPVTDGNTLLQGRPPTGRNYRPLLAAPHRDRFGYAESALLWVDVVALDFPWEPVDPAIEISKRPIIDPDFLESPTLTIQAGINGFPTQWKTHHEGVGWRRDSILGLYGHKQIPLVQLQHVTMLNREITLICDYKGAMMEVRVDKGVLYTRIVKRHVFGVRLRNYSYGSSAYYYEVERKLGELMCAD